MFVKLLYVVHCVLGEFICALVNCFGVDLEFVPEGVMERGLEGACAAKCDRGVVDHIGHLERGF